MIRKPKPTEPGDRPPDPTDVDVYVIGDGAVGAAVTRRFLEDDHAVALISESLVPQDPDVPVHRADPTDVPALTDAGLGAASTVIVATSSDSRNLLVAQLVRTRFDVDRVLVVANQPDRVRVLSDAGHDPLCAATTIADALVDQV